jgi:hypothetical protein
MQAGLYADYVDYKGAHGLQLAAPFGPITASVQGDHQQQNPERLRDISRLSRLAARLAASPRPARCRPRNRAAAWSTTAAIAWSLRSSVPYGTRLAYYERFWNEHPERTQRNI